MPHRVQIKDFLTSHWKTINIRGVLSTLSFVQLVQIGTIASTVAAKSLFDFWFYGPRHPAWDLCIQLLVDIGANVFWFVFPYHENDKNVDSVDFSEIVIPSRNCSPNIATWPKDKGMYRRHHINTQNVSINTSQFYGIEAIGPKLAKLVQADNSLDYPRLLDCEIILGNRAIQNLETNAHSVEELLRLSPVSQGEKIVIYLHGGGWMGGCIDTHRVFAGEISQASGVRIVTVKYRLSPEHEYPAHLHDAYIAFSFLVNQGFQSSDIVIAGDSSGGHLALALAHLLRYIGSPVPAGLVLISPISNLRHIKSTFGTSDTSDYIISHPLESPMSFVRIMYAPGKPLTRRMKKELESPLVSPIFGSFVRFPPTLIQTGGCEVTCDDNAALYGKIKQDNIGTSGIVLQDVYDGMPSVFQAIFSYRPEAIKSLEVIGEFIRNL